MPRGRSTKLELSPRQVEMLSSTFNLDGVEVQDSLRAISEWNGSEEGLRAFLSRRYSWQADVAARYLGALLLAVLRSGREAESPGDDGVRTVPRAAKSPLRSKSRPPAPDGENRSG